MKPLARLSHRGGEEFLENLAYECKFGERYSEYLRELLTRLAKFDQKFYELIGQWRGVIGAKTQLEEAELMIEALQRTGGAQDIIDHIKSNFQMPRNS